MNEQAIVRRCLEGDTESFRRIVSDHEGPLMAAAVTILGNRQEAEDLCQETFIQAYRHLASFDGGRNLRAWLYTILYRRCLNSIRRRRRLVGVLDRLRAEPLSPWVPSRDPGPGDPSPLPAVLFEALNAKERTVLSLWVNEGFTAVEIAAILGCPQGTARYYLFNIRKKIRALAEKKHENLPKR